MAHKGWHRRGYLPHCDVGGSWIALTFRLADSLPQEVIERWKTELQLNDEGRMDEEARRAKEDKLHRNIARYEDAGHGSCLLGRPGCASAIQAKLIEGHGERYNLLHWCVMPNHVHVLLHVLPSFPLGETVKRWKGGSAMEIHRKSGGQGRLWMPDYHDRFIRDDDHYWSCKEYIELNPVKAGLCEKPADWEFSSAGMGWGLLERGL